MGWVQAYKDLVKFTQGWALYIIECDFNVVSDVTFETGNG